MKRLFGKTKNGKEVYLYTLENKNGMKAIVSDYGALLINLFVPDKDDVLEDVVLGYDTLEEYFVNDSFFGATIAPNANRIGNASFVLDGITYHLSVNDGVNNLHSDKELASHKRVWDAVQVENEVTFSLDIADGEMGFPGNKNFVVTYKLTDNNELILEYHATSDKNTIINPTNHTYFNLSGHGGKAVDQNHRIQLMGSRYTPSDQGSIPTGEIAEVAATPMDLTQMIDIGAHIDDNFDQLTMAGGYDHNWVIDSADGSLKLFATVQDMESGRKMEAYTTLPGVQFYAGNFISQQIGKSGKQYSKRSGLCLETQFYPDTANKQNFPSAVFGPDRKYHSTTVYKFIS